MRYLLSRHTLTPLACAVFVANHASHAQVSESEYTVVLPSMTISQSSSEAAIHGYVQYDQAQVSRGNVMSKDIPQTIDIISVQKNRLYGTNDLSSIVEGNAGIDANYDMRGESINIRGFSVDASDIYLDGVRASGQVRRSTANVERVEILKGPSSVLYGRSGGGGIINMVSKSANFSKRSLVGLRTGSHSTYGANADVNQIVNDNFAVRVTADYEQGDTSRWGIDYKNVMFSPSIRYRSADDNLDILAQYTYDKAVRIPDRGPDRATYDAMGVDYRQSFARTGDEVEDTLHFVKTALSYKLSDAWQLKWDLGYRSANQNFDHFYAGSYDNASRLLSQNYAWQETKNQTLSNNLLFVGDIMTGKLRHELTTGYDYSKEKRHPLLFFKANHSKIDPHNPTSWPTNTHKLAVATTDNRHTGEAHGVFIQDIITLNPVLKLSLGGRYDHYRFDSVNIKGEHQSAKDGYFSPNVGIVWQPTPQHSLYASYAKSFAPYGGNGYLGVTIGDARTVNQEPEYNTQYEVGVKSDWMDGKLTSTFAMYDLLRHNLRYRPDPANDPYTYAIRGEERSRGAELSIMGQIAPSWYVRGSLGLMNAKITKDNSNPALVGKHLNGTSSWQGNVFVRYAPSTRYFGEAGITHIDKRHYYNTRTLDDASIDGFTRVDVMAGYRHNQALSATFAIHNLLDKDYWRSSAMPAEPRTFMARLTYEF